MSGAGTLETQLRWGGRNHLEGVPGAPQRVWDGVLALRSETARPGLRGLGLPAAAGAAQ